MKVEERLRVRHGAQSKFAKNLKRFRNMDDKQTRDQYHTLIQERNALVQKTKKVNRDDSSEGLSESDEGSEGMDSDEDVDHQGLKNKMINKMLKEADGDDQGSDSDENNSDSDSDEAGGQQQIRMRFDKSAKERQMKAQKKTEKGIMGLKFMERAQEKEKEALKA